MDELRVVRREEQSLIVANESGQEFRLRIDESILADLKHLARQSTDGPRVNPREIQALVRAGKTREEILEITGVDESDIERYEEPVLAERRFILQTAQAVAVRVSPIDEEPQQFGGVIAERLIGLGASKIEWKSWRDEDAGWMVGLAFTARGADHNAVWAFDHRKGLLSPITPDASTLSKQGEVGDQLIPRLRAVDNHETRERFESGAFGEKDLPPANPTSPTKVDSDDPVEDDTLPAPMSAGTEAAMRAGHPSTASIPVIDSDAEFSRRREIDQRAIKTPDDEEPDLGQTADLLDALRRRRGARNDSSAPPSHDDGEDSPLIKPVPLRGLEPVDDQDSDAQEEAGTDETVQQTADPQEATDSGDQKARKGQPSQTQKRGKGRAAIPSWDDILFGTRSEEDPS